MKSFVLALLVTLLSFGLTAQTVWEHYLYPSQINNVEDFDGKLWISTEVGLYEVDKTSHNVIYHDRANFELPSLKVEGITQDALGRKWIGTYDNRVAMYDDDKWTNVEVPNDLFTIGEFDPDPLFYCIKYFDDAIWIGTNYGVLNYKDNEWKLLEIDLSSNFFSAVWSFASNDETLYAGSNIAYQYTSANGWESLEDSLSFELFAYSDAHVYETRNWGLFFMTDIGTIGNYRGDDLTIYSTLDTGDLEIPIFINQVSSVTGNEEEGIFVNSPSNGIIRFDGSSWEEIEMTTEGMIQYYFIDDDNKHWYIIDGVLYDEENTAIRLVNHGLLSGKIVNVEIGKENSHVLDYYTPISLDDWSKNDEIDQFVYAIDNSNDDILFLGGRDNLIVVKDDESISNIPYPNSNNFAFATDIVAFSEQDIWVLSYRSVFHYDGNIWTSIQSTQEGSFRDLTKGDNGDVFFSFIHFEGICSSNTEVYHILENGQTNVTHFCGYNILKRTASNDVYLATRDGYMHKFAPETQSWEINDFSMLMEDMGYLFDFDVRADSTYYFAANNGVAIKNAEETIIYNVENTLLYNKPVAIDIDERNNKVWLTIPSKGLQTFSLQDADSTVITEVLETEKSLIEVFPNPVFNYLKVEGVDFKNMDKIFVLDALGKYVKTKMLYNGDNNLLIDVSNLPNGAYFLMVSSKNERQSISWIKH